MRYEASAKEELTVTGRYVAGVLSTSVVAEMISICNGNSSF